MCFVAKGSGVELVVMSIHFLQFVTVPHSFLGFPDFDTFEVPRQVFLRDIPQQGCLMLLPDEVQVMHLGQKYLRSDARLFSFHAVRWGIILIYFIIYNIHFGNLIKLVFTRLLKFRNTLSPL